MGTGSRAGYLGVVAVGALRPLVADFPSSAAGTSWVHRGSISRFASTTRSPVSVSIRVFRSSIAATVPVTPFASTRYPGLKSGSRRRYTPATVSSIISESAYEIPNAMKPTAVPRLAAMSPMPTTFRNVSATPNQRKIAASVAMDRPRGSRSPTYIRSIEDRTSVRTIRTVAYANARKTSSRAVAVSRPPGSR